MYDHKYKCINEPCPFWRHPEAVLRNCTRHDEPLIHSHFYKLNELVKIGAENAFNKIGFLVKEKKCQKQ